MIRQCRVKLKMRVQNQKGGQKGPFVKHPPPPPRRASHIPSFIPLDAHSSQRLTALFRRTAFCGRCHVPLFLSLSRCYYLLFLMPPADSGPPFVLICCASAACAF